MLETSPQGTVSPQWRTTGHLAMSLVKYFYLIEHIYSLSHTSPMQIILSISAGAYLLCTHLDINHNIQTSFESMWSSFAQFATEQLFSRQKENIVPQRGWLQWW